MHLANLTAISSISLVNKYLLVNITDKKNYLNVVNIEY